MKNFNVCKFAIFFILVINTSIAQPSATSVLAGTQNAVVGEFTGALNLNFPLAAVSNGSVSAGINVGYVGNGFKPNNTSSEVGFDWYMSTGFSVTRTIMGFPDEFYGVTNERGDPYDATNIIKNKGDGEYDLYSATAFGTNIQFTVNYGTVFMVNKTDLKVVVYTDNISQNSVTKVKVTNIDGTFVTFLPTMRSVKTIKVRPDLLTWATYNDVNINTGFMPDSLVSYDGNVIKYDYDVNFRDYSYNSIGNEQVKGRIKQLNRIFGYNDTISLTYEFRQDLISASPTNQIGRVKEVKYHSGVDCYKHEFSFSYFTGTGAVNEQLKLNSLQKKSCDATVFEPPTSFLYNDNLSFAPKSTTGIDHWGFYNGSTTNDKDNMIPTAYGGNANRNPDTTRVKYCMMTSMTNANGKTTIFNYSPHYRHVGINQITGSTINVCHLVNTSCSLPTNDYFFTTYTPATFVNGMINVTATPENYNALVTLDIYRGSLNSAITKQISWNPVNSSSMSFPLANILDNSGNPFFINGYVYYIKITVFRCTAQMVYSYLTTGYETVGGLRIRSINDGGQITNYSYDKGMLYNEANYYEKFNIDNWLTINAQSINLNYMSGAHIGYGSVSTSKPGLGRTVSRFNHAFIKETNYGIRNVCDLLSQGIGNLVSKSVYDNSNVLQTFDTIEYRTDNFAFSNNSNRFFEKSNCNFLGNNCTFYGIRYNYKQFIVRPLRKTSYIKGVITAKSEFEYNHPHTVQPSVVKSMTTGLAETLVWTDYTNNNWSGTNVKQYCINKNIIIPYTTHTYENGVLIDKKRTDYTYYSNTGAFVGNSGSSNASNIVRPATEYETDYDGLGGAGLETPQYYYHEYTSDGFIKNEQKANWPSKQSSYDRKRIASITSNGFTTATTYFGNSNLVKKVTSYDNTYVDFAYDKLSRLSAKTSMPSSNQISYTYYFGSPFNLISETETIAAPVGGSTLVRTTFNNYDIFGRLVEILHKEFTPITGGVKKNLAAVYNEYDANGRLLKEYLPFIDSGVFASTPTFIPLPPSQKFKEIKYEASPLSRITEVISAEWHPVLTTYGFNASSTDNIQDPQQSYSQHLSNRLFKEILIDANGNRTIKFTDFKGRLVCSRQSNANDDVSARKDTYYKYDTKNRLILIIPPGAVEANSDLVYKYEYDMRDRLKRKKIPGSGWMEYWYNTKDQVAAMQDANMLASAKYIAYKYDTDGRETQTGFVSSISNLESPVFTTLLTENTYSIAAGIEYGKIKTSRVNVLGTSSYLKKVYNYDARGRVSHVNANNINNVGESILYDTYTNTYDNADNITQAVQAIKPYLSNINSGITQSSMFAFDHRDRLVTEKFSYNGGTSVTIATNEYSFKGQLLKLTQGPNYQSLDFNYRNNGMFQGLNSATLGTDLFHYQLYHDDPVPLSGGQIRKNGEISNIRWQRAGDIMRINTYGYDNYNQLLSVNFAEYSGTNIVSSDKYDEAFSYAPDGKLTSLIRNGHSPYGTNFQIDNLSYMYGANSYRLSSVTENLASANTNRLFGFNPNGAPVVPFDYDANGNLIKDLYRGVTSITYNHLNLPVEVIKSTGVKIKMFYDAIGTLLKRETYGPGSVLSETRTYIGNIELVNNVIDQIMHSQGRYKNIAGTFRQEYTIKDHLGNTRIVYADVDNNGVINSSEILDENHYYAYGMEYTGTWTNVAGTNYNYKFNGIERVESFNLDFATYRGLDPIRGVWQQVDPKAESSHNMSPYCAMGNNPISNIDPDGDEFFTVVAIAYAAGVLMNGFNNLDNGYNFWSSGMKAGLWSAASAAVTFGIGEGFELLGKSLLREIGRAGAHALSQGTITHLQGGNFWHGAASGGISSGIGSGIGALGGNAADQIVGGGVGGGFGSMIAGGNFWQGYTTGLIVGAFNHAMQHNVGQVESEVDFIFKKLTDKYQMTPSELREALATLAESNWVSKSSNWAKGDGNFKCSNFVNDLISELGMKHHIKLLSSGEWFKKLDIPGWTKIIDGTLQRGDLGVMNGHMGIMRNEKSLIYAGTSKSPDVIKSAKIADFKRPYIGWRYTGLLLFIYHLNLYIDSFTKCDHTDIDNLREDSYKEADLYKSLPYIIRLDENNTILTNDDVSFFEGSIDTIKLKENLAFLRLVNNYNSYEDQINCYISYASEIDDKFIYLSVVALRSIMTKREALRLIESGYSRFEQAQINDNVLTLLLDVYLKAHGPKQNENISIIASQLFMRYLMVHHISITNKLLLEKCLSVKN